MDKFRHGKHQIGSLLRKKNEVEREKEREREWLCMRKKKEAIERKRAS